MNPSPPSAQPYPIELSFPTLPIATHTKQHSFIDLRVSVRLMLPFVPSPAPKEADPIVQRLLKTDTEAILDGSLKGMIRNARPRCYPMKEVVDGYAIAHHIGVVHVCKQANYPLPMMPH